MTRKRRGRPPQNFGSEVNVAGCPDYVYLVTNQRRTPHTGVTNDPGRRAYKHEHAGSFPRQ